MTKEEIEQAAREYSTGKSSSDVFREAHETDFIAGANWALQSENERLKAERGWILCDDDMPEVDETVWITNGCGWTALGCLVECEGGYCWAVTNGIIYEEDGKIVSECELDDDYDVVYWHRLPQPPKQSCPQCKTEYTKEELLTNEHCFKCGFEMKGF